MLARVLSGAILGIEASPVWVEVDLAGGLPALNMVGLPDTAVRESRDRVRSAIQNSGFSFPPRRITVNLAPAHLRKEGTSLDLPVAIGILLAAGTLRPEQAEKLFFAGELSLDGSLRPVKGAISLALAAKGLGCRGILLPEAVAGEASVVEGIPVYPVRSLSQVVAFLAGEEAIGPLVMLDYAPGEILIPGEEDLRDVAGQAAARRALEVAAAGGHNLLLVGPPGAGKTMLARRLPGILPPLSRGEAVETTRIHSAAGLSNHCGLLKRRPFRAPHHSISGVGLAGGGPIPKPGEASLAHHGVLFLDELPEFKRGALEVLRQPMEEGRVVINRSLLTLEFPARFMLIAAMNPCPCGQLGSAGRSCACTPHQISGYRGRVSGPLLDRFDIHLEVPRVRAEDLGGRNGAESSAVVRERVLRAREIQTRRLAVGAVPLDAEPAAAGAKSGLSSEEKTQGATVAEVSQHRLGRCVGAGQHARCNAEMTSAEVREHCALDAAGRRLLHSAVDRLGLSARAYHRILKVARTLADLADEQRIQAIHLAEAIQYRMLDCFIPTGGPHT
ncbi:MAG: YifB family Mg chelatase-like AAA ATPase [Acidobacteria bacterium]|nr:YifB family Mg chelatase-like AAA ATPase [Acidobacteriota bacterium]